MPAAVRLGPAEGASAGLVSWPGTVTPADWARTPVARDGRLDGCEKNHRRRSCKGRLNAYKKAQKPRKGEFGCWPQGLKGWKVGDDGHLSSYIWASGAG